MKLLICFGLLSIFIAANAQDEHYTKAYNDSVLTLLLTKIPPSNRKSFKEYFNGMKDEERAIFYAMSLPISSKKDLIKNIDTNYRNIYSAITLFKELIPSDLEVYIEFKPPQKLLKLGESVDFWCSRIDKSGGVNPQFHEWNVELSSLKLDSLLPQVNMDRIKLEKLHASLFKAHCISINNRHPVEVGFARSGMGKYYYMIFDKNLTASQIQYYNNGCEYIFYKDNIVLMYGSGAIGSLCFPYEEPE
jgi:hypothetical protein